MTKYRSLHIYDFDQTLVNTPGPDTDLNGFTARDTYDRWLVDQSLPKRKWTGWYGRSETLQPPIFGKMEGEKFIPPPSCLNQEICNSVLKSKANPKTLTVLMTGRHIKMINKNTKVHLVKEIMDAYEISFDRYYYLFSGQLTLPFKCNTIEMILREFPTIADLEVWEDREEHVSKFNDFAKYLTKGKNLDSYKIHAVYPNQPGFDLDGVEAEDGDMSFW